MNDWSDLFKLLTNITEITNHLPTGVNYDIETLDDIVLEKYNFAQSQIISISQRLIDYIQGANSNNRIDSLENQYENALDSLLNSSKFEKETDLDKKTTEEKEYIHLMEINGRLFYYSDKVSKPFKSSLKATNMNTIATNLYIPDFLTLSTQLFDFSNYNLIKTKQQLKNMIEKLKAMTTIFINIEIHRVRTYRPYPCVITIFHPYCGLFVIDVLELRDDFIVIDEILSSAEILKVFFDSELMHIIYEIYGILIHPYLDLSLLYPNENTICDYLKNKGAYIDKWIIDWRIRPLTDDMIKCAIQTMTYLPQIANNSKISLPILEKMNTINEEIFKPYKFTRDDAIKAAENIGKHLKSLKFDVLVDLILWRDELAYYEDESPNFIALDSHIYNIANTLPTSMNSLENCIENIASPYIKAHKSEILNIIRSHIKR